MPVCQKITGGKRCGAPAHDFVVYVGLDAVPLCREHAPVDGTLHNVSREAVLRRPANKDLVQDALDSWTDSVNSG